MRAPDFWAKGHGGVLALLLWPLTWLWRLGARLKEASTQTRRAGVPVISIGNLVVGGSGKTPTAIAVAAALTARGARPHLITRGYGGALSGPHQVDPAQDSAEAVGDEALLLARVAPTWVARDRAQGALAAIEAGASCLVLDDAHQNFALEKDLSILVVDLAYGVGNGHVVPAGPLREPVTEGMKRADAIVAIGQAGSAPGRPLTAAAKPVLNAVIEPVGSVQDLVGRRVLAFAGIGRPEKFFATLTALGAAVVATRAFDDHHRFEPDEIMQMVEAASSQDAILVTTEKDHVRLPPESRAMVTALPVRLRFNDPPMLERLLDRFANVRH